MTTHRGYDNYISAESYLNSHRFNKFDYVRQELLNTNILNDVLNVFSLRDKELNI